MGVRKLDWAVSYSTATGKQLRNEYETEAKANAFAVRQRALSKERGTPGPTVSKLKPRRWEAGYQDHQGRWKTKRFDTKDEATAYFNETRSAISNQTYVDPKRAEGTNVGQLYELWIERIRTSGATGRRPAEPKTIQGYEWIYRRMISPKWQDYPLSNIQYEAVADWTRTMLAVDGRPASADTRSRASRQFSRMLDHAVGLKLVASNPAKDSSGARDYVPEVKTQREAVYLTRPQLERLASCAGRYALLVRFTGLTGLRWGEVTALKVGDLDLGVQPYVSVERAYSEVHGRLVLGDTKGHESREVPLPATLAADLRTAVHGKSPSALLFSSANGLPMRNSNFTRRYYEPARQLASGAVGRVQSFLGVTETRRGLAVFGESTLAGVHEVQVRNGLEVGPGVGPETWVALAEASSSAEQRKLLLGSVGISLRLGDVDFRPPVFHDLRHTAVSLYLAVTKNVKHVQRIAGHKDATTTLNTYAELFEDDFFNAAAGLDGLLAG